MKILITYLFFTPLFALTLCIGTVYGSEWKFKENVYIIPKTEIQAIKYSTLMAGTVEETERYKRLSRKIVSPTLENYTEVSKCVKETMSETNSNGITATFERIVGDVPSDYSYDSVKEEQKLIDTEVQRLKELEEKTLEETAKTNLGLVTK